MCLKMSPFVSCYGDLAKLIPSLYLLFEKFLPFNRQFVCKLGKADNDYYQEVCFDVTIFLMTESSGYFNKEQRK